MHFCSEIMPIGLQSMPTPPWVYMIPPKVRLATIGGATMRSISSLFSGATAAMVSRGGA